MDLYLVIILIALFSSLFSFLYVRMGIENYKLGHKYSSAAYFLIALGIVITTIYMVIKT